MKVELLYICYFARKIHTMSTLKASYFSALATGKWCVSAITIAAIEIACLHCELKRLSERQSTDSTQIFCSYSCLGDRCMSRLCSRERAMSAGTTTNCATRKHSVVPK